MICPEKPASDNKFDTFRLAFYSPILYLFLVLSALRSAEVGDRSQIEWTDATWNPVTGCTKVSPGCKHCYAERLALRLRAMGNPRYRNGFAVTLHPDQLRLPLKWRQPRHIFVNSMSDLFHEAVPEEYIRRVFEIMGQADWHVFQVLTKRAKRFAAPLAPQCLARCFR